MTRSQWKRPAHLRLCSRSLLLMPLAKSPRVSKIPTIGIGSGPHCDGQILVTHDLIGLFPWFTPKFVSPEARVSEEIRKAARAFIYRTRNGAESVLSLNEDDREW